MGLKQMESSAGPDNNIPKDDKEEAEVEKRSPADDEERKDAERPEKPSDYVEEPQLEDTNQAPAVRDDEWECVDEGCKVMNKMDTYYCKKCRTINEVMKDLILARQYEERYATKCYT